MVLYFVRGTVCIEILLLFSSLSYRPTGKLRITVIVGAGDYNGNKRQPGEKEQEKRSKSSSTDLLHTVLVVFYLLLLSNSMMASSNTLEQVRSHLSEIAKDPSKLLNKNLLDKVDAQAIGMKRWKLTLSRS